MFASSMYSSPYFGTRAIQFHKMTGKMIFPLQSHHGLANAGYLSKGNYAGVSFPQGHELHHLIGGKPCGKRNIECNKFSEMPSNIQHLGRPDWGRWRCDFAPQHDPLRMNLFSSD